jgi:hypothetical protein
MLARNWLSLPAGLIWAMTRDADLTEKVQADPEVHKNICLGIAHRLTVEKVVARYFDNASKAWLALRDLIADEKIRAEGHLIERRGLGLHSAKVTDYPNTPIPSGEAGNLILLDNWGGFTETVLGPDELYRFHNGQGRYWKRVRLLAENLFVAFPSNGADGTKRQTGTGQMRRPGPEGARAALMVASRAIGSPRAGEQRQAYRVRLADWIKKNGGTPPSDPKTFRKYGY